MKLILAYIILALINPFFWVILVNVLSFWVSIHLLKGGNWKALFDRLPIPVKKSLVDFNVGTLFILAVLPQAKIQDPLGLVLVPVGLILVLLAVFTWWSAFKQIGAVPGLREKNRVITGGPYRIVRHPIYLGNLLAALGMSLVFSAIDALLYWPVALILYVSLCQVEETSLVREYGDDYRIYQQRVPYRLIPKVF